MQEQQQPRSCPPAALCVQHCAVHRSSNFTWAGWMSRSCVWGGGGGGSAWVVAAAGGSCRWVGGQSLRVLACAFLLVVWLAAAAADLTWVWSGRLGLWPHSGVGNGQEAGLALEGCKLAGKTHRHVMLPCHHVALHVCPLRSHRTSSPMAKRRAQAKELVWDQGR